MTRNIKEKYNFLTPKVLNMPSIVKEVLFNTIVLHRNVFMFFLKEYLEIYQEIESEWGQYDPLSVTFDMDLESNIKLSFYTEGHKFCITYDRGELDQDDAELELKIDGKRKLLVKEQPNNRPMVTIERY